MESVTVKVRGCPRVAGLGLAVLSRHKTPSVVHEPPGVPLVASARGTSIRRHAVIAATTNTLKYKDLTNVVLSFLAAVMLLMLSVTPFLPDGPSSSSRPHLGVVIVNGFEVVEKEVSALYLSRVL